MGNYKNLLLTKKEKIGTITINRPEVSNAMDHDTYVELKGAVDEFAVDDEVSVLVITGTGKHFCAGGDIKSFKKMLDAGEWLNASRIMEAGFTATAIRKCPKPVIAMVNGAAAGGGCAIALACDYRVVSKRSKLIMAFINLALTGDTGGIYYLSRLVGVEQLSKIIMTGEPISGEEALRIGLATEYTEDNDMLEELTYKLASKFAKGPTFAYGLQKQLINEYLMADLDAYSMREAQYMEQASRTDDFKEAVNAFLEKRPAHFTGK